MKLTPVKLRITKILGPTWRHVEIARQAGVARVSVTRELGCTEDASCTARHTPQVQEAIAKAIGLSTGKLFGRHAWFRVAGKALSRRKAQ